MKKLSELSVKARMALLVTCANELNSECGFDPPIKTKKVDEEDLLVALKEAGGLLEPDDELSPESTKVLGELGYLPKDFPGAMKVDDDDEDDGEGDEDLLEVVKAAKTLKDLKALVEENDEFEDLMEDLAKQKRPAALKKEMIALLADDGEEEEEEEPEPVKKPKGKKAKVVPDDEDDEDDDDDDDDDDDEDDDDDDEEPVKKKRGRTATKSKEKEVTKKAPVKKKAGPSNKGRIYKEWNKRKKKPTADELHDLVDGAVKVSTIRSWTSSWSRGEKLPAGAE